MKIKFKLVFIVFSVVLLSSCGLEFEKNHNEYNTGTSDRSTSENAEATRLSISNYILMVDEVPPFTSEGTEENTFSFYSFSQESKLEINPITYSTGGIIGFYSKDGSRVLRASLDFNTNKHTYEIVDIKSKQIIFTKSVDRGSNWDSYIFFPNLGKYIIEKNDGMYVCNIDKNTIDKLVFEEKEIDLLNILFSPDENKMAYIVEKNDEKYIHIYDIPSMKIINEILIGKGNIYLSHWSNNNRITYNYEMDAYAINDDGTNKEYLGKYVFYPIYSPDGRYLIYSKPATFVYIESLLDIEGYEKENELGLYVLDIKTKEVKVIRSESRDLIPIQWIENQL